MLVFYVIICRMSTDIFKKDEFQKRLKYARTAFGFTQQQVAEYLDLTLRSYQRYESGDCAPPITMLLAIADLYDISLDYLLCRDNFIQSHGAFVGGHGTYPLTNPKS